MTMHYHYYAIGSSSPRVESVPLIDLAKYIMTEWLPVITRPAVDGMTDLLNTILVREKLEGGRYFWCMNQELSFADRQWKGMTSWIIGVALARHVAEMEGYPWWSPVSSFTGHRMTKTGMWLLPHIWFDIRKRPLAKSRLYPDYVVCRLSHNVCRLSHNGWYDFAFIESKGTEKNFAGWAYAKSDWRAQASSAELYYGGARVPVSRNLIVATRINPGETEAEKRQIVVRAWSSDNPITQGNRSMFVSFLLWHYGGICARIGINALTRLMSECLRLIMDREEDYFDGAHLNRLSRSYREELERLRYVSDTGGISLASQLQDHTYSPDESVRVVFGSRRLQVQLTSAATRLILALIGGDWDQIQSAVTSQVETTSAWVREYQTSEDVGVLLNGVVVNRVD